MKTQAKQHTYYVPIAIQKLFVIPIAVLFLLQTTFIATATISQALQGSDYRPQAGYLLLQFLLPLAIFCMAYGLNPRRLPRLARTFEALLICISAYIVWTYINMLLPVILMAGHRAFIENARLYEYVSSVLFIGFYTVVLLLVRKKGLWG
ncbi:MAG TPA: hypothetical protein VF597_00245 [Candidatus Saccharimonadales bacterium]|jgi:hypothetical protein